MARYDLKLLDCTLRDGGYINDWKWGFRTAREMIQLLVRAGVDVVEVGFLRNVEGYNPDVSVCNQIEELNRLVPDVFEHTIFSAMAMRSNYDIQKLSPYSGKGIRMIRVTAHDYDIADGMSFAKEVRDKGYLLSINPINIMGYSDERILWILDQVNRIQPYQFSIVDTFGSMKHRHLDRIVSLVDHNLDRNIRVALHLHENMSLAFSLAQSFIGKHLNRPVAVDASLTGMGRVPGNLPIELIADYLNDYAGKSYDIDYMMDAIQDYISPLKGENAWGYTPAYFLSARYNLHRNYAEYYLKKGDLTHRDINHILARIDRSKTTVFDPVYADQLYMEYQNRRICDQQDRERLRGELKGKDILILAPGSSIVTFRDKILETIRTTHPTVISVNFIPADFPVNYAFFSNHKRYERIYRFPCKVIVTSNFPKTEYADYRLDYNTLSGAFSQGCNSFIMLLKLLRDMDVKSISSAGADGYQQGSANYYNPAIRSSTEHGSSFNAAVADAIRNLNVAVDFLTPSEYDLR